MDELYSPTKLAPGTGTLGEELEKDDHFLLSLVPERIDETWPQTTQGNKDSLGNSCVHVSNEMPGGVFSTERGYNDPVEDPPVSQAQAAAMHAAAEGHSTIGIPKSVGQDFVNAAHGMKVGQLPVHVRHKK